MFRQSLTYLCFDVKPAIAEIKALIGAHGTPPELLDSFWCLQDQLHRLLAHVRDNPSDFQALGAMCPDLAPEALRVLTSAVAAGIYEIPAVRNACRHINEYLIQLEHAHEQERTRNGNPAVSPAVT